MNEPLCTLHFATFRIQNLRSCGEQSGRKSGESGKTKRNKTTAAPRDLPLSKRWIRRCAGRGGGAGSTTRGRHGRGRRGPRGWWEGRAARGSDGCLQSNKNVSN